MNELNMNQLNNKIDLLCEQNYDLTLKCDKNNEDITILTNVVHKNEKIIFELKSEINGLKHLSACDLDNITSLQQKNNELEYKLKNIKKIISEISNRQIKDYVSFQELKVLQFKNNDKILKCINKMKNEIDNLISEIDVHTKWLMEIDIKK
tara:strand:+ start:129 stop:581 length:453 start_codon:yes stop_codon:yes gene_type:complete